MPDTTCRCQSTTKRVPIHSWERFCPRFLSGQAHCSFSIGSRPEIAFLLPSPHREALQPELRRGAISLREVLMAACGLTVGAETHVLWDSFTHGTGWGVRRVPVLGETVWEGQVPVYLILQYLTTVLGLCVLLYVYGKWLKTLGPGPVWPQPSWRLLLWLVVLAACFIVAGCESHPIHAIANFRSLHGRHFAFVLLTSFVRNVLVAVCAASICIKILNIRRGRHGVRFLICP
jgi:hypothetical protein